MKKNYDFSKGKRGAPVSREGKSRITIYLDNEILAGFRAQAEQAGRGYQTLINDALGLGHPTGTELVVVEYPSTFGTGPSCAQPTCLDVSWERPGGSYVSYHEFDSWGRTCSTSGTKAPRLERVHSTFKNLSAQFAVKYLGQVTSDRASSRRVLAEGYRRLAPLLT